MKKGLVAGLLLASVTVTGLSQPTHALHGDDGLTQSLLVRAQQAEENVQSATDRKTQRQAELEAKRQAIEQKIADRRAAVMEKLTGERAERCNQKEVTINQILDDRATAAERHLGKLEAIHEKLAAFATEKELDVDNAGALELILTEKQGNAQAAVAAVKALDFDCAIADASAPGMIVKDQFTEAKQALKGYRDAIRDYAIAIRSAAAEPKLDQSTESTENETEMQPEAGENGEEQNQEVTQ